MGGGNGNYGSLNLGAGSDQLLYGAEGGGPVLTCQGIGACHVHVHNRLQGDRFSLLSQLMDDPGVVTPEGAYSHHCHANGVVWIQRCQTASCRNSIDLNTKVEL
jgi:hypothetical protein